MAQRVKARRGRRPAAAGVKAAPKQSDGAGSAGLLGRVEELVAENAALRGSNKDLREEIAGLAPETVRAEGGGWTNSCYGVRTGAS